MTHVSLVIGSTGTTGRRLVRRLRSRGIEVRAASRTPKTGEILFDWHRPETYHDALIGAQSVYLITPAMVEDPTPVVEPFLEHARSVEVDRIVLLSSMGVEFLNEDGTSGRHRVERALQRSGVSWTILRPGGFSQNFSESFLLPMIMQADMIGLATGNGAVAYVDAEDIAAVAEATLLEPAHHNATYVLTGPESLTGEQAAEIVSEAAGRKIVYRDMTSGEFEAMLQGAGIPVNYAAAMVRNQDAIRAGWSDRITDDVRRVTGRTPIAFTEFATNASDAWKKVV